MASKNKDLQPNSNDGEIEDFFAKMSQVPVLKPVGSKGRLIFAMDATASREPAWDQACQIQHEMFAETEALGGLKVQLVWYRGFAGFGASSWLESSGDLIRNMERVRCLGGQTQIENVLDHALSETRGSKVNALVFVGDCVEEDVDRLCNLAGKLGLTGVPVFIFQEGYEPHASNVFRQIAQLSGGAHCRFDVTSAKQLRELLAAVAVYAAGGRKALEDYGKSKGGEILLLSSQLSGKN